MERYLVVHAALLLAACGSNVELYEADTGGGSDVGQNVRDVEPTPTPDDVAVPGDVGEDVGEPTDASEDEEEEEEPTPQPLTPCATADCWDATLGGPPCATVSHDEDYASGNYNVHRYSSMLWDGTPTRISVARTAGAWEPVLVVTNADGVVLFDGAVGLNTAEVSTTVHAAYDVTIESDIATPLSIHVTSIATRDSGFSARIPTDARYTVSIASDCGAREACVFNGNTAREPACGWMHYVAYRVVPQLPGDRDERLQTAAIVAWWALKEGVMYLQNPIVYSNCNFPSGDQRIGPLDRCVDNRAWQVGLSAVQVPYHTDAKIEGFAATLYPNLSIAEILRRTAIEAQLSAADVQAVVNSTGTLRRSWLLRNSAIGFVTEAPVVKGECIDDSRGWCYGTGWDTTQLFAPTRAAALRAIDDVRAFLDRLAP